MALQLIKVKQEDSKQRLDAFLAGIITDAPSRSFVKKLIDGGHVKVNESVVKAHHKVSEGEEVLVEIPEDFLAPTHIAAEDIPLDIFYEDDYLIVINKPKGLLVHPTTNCFKGTLVNALLNYSKNLSDFNTSMRPGIVHRLDKETSGLMLVAKDNITHTKLAKKFQRHEIKKQYVALVQGYIELDEGIVNVPLGRHVTQREKKAVKFDESAKESQTVYKVRKRHNGVTLVSLFPKTGRTHQLRVHMAYLKHPILGDDKYGSRSSFTRLALHAQSIGFKHPHSKIYVEFTSLVPNEFLKKVDQA